MKFLSRLARRISDRVGHAAVPEAYDSLVRIESRTRPGVSFVINKISFGRRMELARKVREISQKAEFLQAGDELQDRIEANLLRQEVEATYVRWGLLQVHGLTIDGEPATAEKLLEKGPDDLTHEVVGAVKKQCCLTEEERKN